MDVYILLVSSYLALARSRDRALPQKMMAHNVSRTVSVVFFLVHRSAQTLNS